MADIYKTPFSRDYNLDIVEFRLGDTFTYDLKDSQQKKIPKSKSNPYKASIPPIPIKKLKQNRIRQQLPSSSKRYHSSKRKIKKNRQRQQRDSPPRIHSERTRRRRRKSGVSNPRDYFHNKLKKKSKHSHSYGVATTRKRSPNLIKKHRDHNKKRNSCPSALVKSRSNSKILNPQNSKDKKVVRFQNAKLDLDGSIVPNMNRLPPTIVSGNRSPRTRSPPKTKSTFKLPSIVL